MHARVRKKGVLAENRTRKFPRSSKWMTIRNARIALIETNNNDITRT